VQPGAIVENKRLSAVLEQVKAQQTAYPARQHRGSRRDGLAPAKRAINATARVGF
jgi:hypothetical protein